MTTARALAAGAAALGLGAVLAGGSAAPGSDPGVAELTVELAEGTPWVDPLELAAWIRDRRPLRLLDLRDSGAFTRLSLPTAEHVTLADLPAAAAGAEAGAAEVVLYDDGSGSAVRGWILLRRLGYPRVRLLRGGVVGWIDGVLEPVLPAGTPEERAAYRRAAELSRYFGGVPRIGERRARGAGAARAEEAVRLLSRRGCF